MNLTDHSTQLCHKHQPVEAYFQNRDFANALRDFFSQHDDIRNTPSDNDTIDDYSEDSFP
jgi:hypothetical protein